MWWGFTCPAIFLYLVSFIVLIKHGSCPMDTLAVFLFEPKFSPVIVNVVDPSSGPFSGFIWEVKLPISQHNIRVLKIKAAVVRIFIINEKQSVTSFQNEKKLRKKHIRWFSFLVLKIDKTVDYLFKGCKLVIFGTFYNLLFGVVKGFVWKAVLWPTCIIVYF